MRWFCISLVLLINGCASRQVQTLTNLPLPAAHNQNCCWQALQQLDITYQQQHYPLTGVFAQTANDMTLVLLDSFGRRVFSVSKHGDNLNTYRSPELPAGLPEQFLLASSMLVWWPLADWQTLLSSANSGWQISSTAATRELSYQGRAVLRATYPDGSKSVQEGMNAATANNHERVLLEHLHQPLTISIVTNNWELL